MFFNTIDRYIFRELLKIFLISVIAMTMVLYLDKFLFIAEMIVNRGVSFMEMVMMMTYISPAFFAITIPIAVLMASVVTFNQFSAHNEWVAMKSCSRSFIQLMKPVLFFSLFSYFLANIIMFWALPWGNESYKSLVYDIIKNRANINIQPNVFNRDFNNLILLVKEHHKDSLLKGVFIADTRNPEAPEIITSEEGIIFPNPKTLKIQLKLNNGIIHETSKERGEYQILNFDRYDLNLSLPDTERLEKEALVGNRELSISKLKEKIIRMKAKGLPTSGAEVELSKKFSIPITCLLFAFLGAPLGIKSSRSGKSGSFGITIAVILIYYLGLIVTQNLGRIGEIHAYTSVWIPNIILIVTIVYVNYKMQKELPFKFFENLISLLITIVEILKNIFCDTSRKRIKTVMKSRKSFASSISTEAKENSGKVYNLNKQD